MSELETWKRDRSKLTFDEWAILEGLIVRSANFEGMSFEGNIDGKFCVFYVEFDGDFDGVQYHTTIELVKEEELK